MNFNERTITEPYTLRGVSTVPEEGGTNLSQQCDKAVLPYFTRKKHRSPAMILIFFPLLSRLLISSLLSAISSSR